jgi:hypothetical protein
MEYWCSPEFKPQLRKRNTKQKNLGVGAHPLVPVTQEAEDQSCPEKTMRPSLKNKPNIRTKSLG